MKKADLLSTLFVGIDISSRENVVAVMDFESTKPIASFAVPNNEPGAEEMAKKISAFITPESGLKRLVIGLESTSFYGVQRVLTCLWKSLSNSSARKVATDFQIHRKQPSYCRQLQKIHTVWTSACMSL